MIKLFGFRISKILCVLLGLEILVLLLSVALGLFLYMGKQPQLWLDPVFLNNTINQTSIFILFLLLLSPGLFFYINTVLRHQKKWLEEMIASVVIATMTMGLLYVSFSPLDAQGIFVIAVLSASSGMIITQTVLLYKRWRFFLVRSGMN